MLWTGLPLGYAISRRRATVSINCFCRRPSCFVYLFLLPWDLDSASRGPMTQGWPVSSQQSAQDASWWLMTNGFSGFWSRARSTPMGFTVHGVATLADAPSICRATTTTPSFSTCRLARPRVSACCGRCVTPPAIRLIFLSRPGRTRPHRQPAAGLSMGLRVAGMLQKARVALRAAGAVAGRAGAPHPPGCGPPATSSVAELAKAIQERYYRAVFSATGFVAGRRGGGGGSAGPLARRGRGPRLSPEVFVPMAEQSGLIVPLTFQIMRASLEACGRWRVATSGMPGRGQHLSAGPGRSQPARRNRTDVDRNGLGPGALIAEITESTVIAHPVLAAEVLTRLRIKGDRAVDRRFRHRPFVVADVVAVAVLRTQDRSLVHFGMRNRCRRRGRSCVRRSPWRASSGCGWSPKASKPRRSSDCCAAWTARSVRAGISPRRCRDRALPWLSAFRLVAA